MSKQLPPFPGRDLYSWATRLYEYMISQSPIQGSVDPTPILLSHVVANQIPRATTDGIMLYDPSTGFIRVSKGGEWLDVLSGIQFAALTDGDVLSWDAGLSRWTNSAGGGGAGTAGTAVLTMPTSRYEHEETVAAVGVTPTSKVAIWLAPTVDTDENAAETVMLTSIVAVPATDQLTILAAFGEPHSGPIKLQWSAI